MCKWITFLSSNLGLPSPSETWHLASAPCQRAVCQCACESQITLWWRVPVFIVVCTLHLPSNTYEDLLKERAEQREPALTWQATMATGREAGRTEARGKHTRGRWELLWPACRGHNAQVERPWRLLRRKNNSRTDCDCLPLTKVWLEHLKGGILDIKEI